MSENTGTSSFTTRRIVIDAMMIALFFLLSSTSIRIGNTFKITFDSLACLITAMLFGPVDALLVGLVGEFMAQMISYGFTQTTLLWMLAPAVRGLIPGLGVVLLKGRMSLGAIRRKKVLPYFLVVALASVLASFCNTFALYVDSKLFNYYEYHMVFGVLLVRIGTGLVSAIVMAILVIPILEALRASRVVEVN